MGPANNLQYNVDVSTKAGIKRVTMMGVVSVAEKADKTAIIFPGKQARYRYVNGKPCLLLSYFPPSPCYVYQCELAGMNSKMFWIEQSSFWLREVICLVLESIYF